MLLQPAAFDAATDGPFREEWAAPFFWGERDVPFGITFGLQSDPVLDSSLTFDSCSPDILSVRRSLLAAALMGYLDGRWVSVSFSKDWYSGHFLRVSVATYRNVVALGVKAMAAEGLLHLDKAWPQPPGYPGRRWRSRFTLTDRGAQLCREAVLARKIISIAELRGSRVHLFDRNSRQRLTLPGTERQAEINRHLASLTEATSTGVDLAGSEGAAFVELEDARSSGGRFVASLVHHQWTASYLRKPGDRPCALVHSGRPSGFWAQNLPRRHRPLIRIEGRPIDEADIVASHLAILAALRGVNLPSAPYEQIAERAGIEKSLAKRAALILVNSINRQAAMMALVAYCAARRLNLPHKTAAQRRFAAQHRERADWDVAGRITRSVEVVLAPLADCFFQDLGVTCMGVEADILRHAVKRLSAAGEVAIPMHDGLMVGVGRAGLAAEALMAGFHARLGRSCEIAGG